MHSRFQLDLDDVAGASSMGLLGACVGRDLRAVLFPWLSTSQFLWRISTVSLMSAAPSHIDLSGRIASREELMSADRDINKSFDLDAFLAERFVVLDFFRDTYGVIRLTDGRFITHGFEFDRYRLKEMLDIAEAIPREDPRYPDLWLESFQRFAGRANASQASFIIQPILQMPGLWQQDRFVVRPEWEGAALRFGNRILGHMQRIALASLRRACLLPIPYEDMELEEAHEYGLAPYHYTRRYFERSLDLVRRCPEAALALDPGDPNRARIVEAEMNEWRGLVRHGWFEASPTAC